MFVVLLVYYSVFRLDCTFRLAETVSVFFVVTTKNVLTTNNQISSLRQSCISCCLKYLLSSSSTSTRFRKYLTENLLLIFLY